MKGDEAYCILGFRVPTTSVGARDAGQRGAKGVKGSKGSKGERSIFYTRFYGPHHLWEQGVRGEGERRGGGGRREQRGPWASLGPRMKGANRAKEPPAYETFTAFYLI